MKQSSSPTRLVCLVFAVFGGVTVVFLSCMAFGPWAWGVAQIGSAANWFSAITTIAAVVVALRSSHQAKLAADQAIKTADDRVEEERKFNHRRETTKAVSELWSTVVALREPVIAFYNLDRGPQAVVKSFKTGIDAPGDALDAVSVAFSLIDAKLFYANVIALEPHLIAEIRTLGALLTELQERVLKFPETENLEADRAALRLKLNEILGRQTNLLNTVRDHLPLLKGAEEQLAADARWLENNWGKPQGPKPA